MPMNWAAKRLRADRMIRKRGYKAYLRRAGLADRPCWAAEDIETINPQTGQLSNIISRVFLVSPLWNGAEISPPPFWEKDSLVTLVYSANPDPYLEVEDKVLKLNQPVGTLSQAGLVLYYEVFTVR